MAKEKPKKKKDDKRKKPSAGAGRLTPSSEKFEGVIEDLEPESLGAVALGCGSQTGAMAEAALDANIWKDLQKPKRPDEIDVDLKKKERRSRGKKRPS